MLQRGADAPWGAQHKQRSSWGELDGGEKVCGAVGERPDGDGDDERKVPRVWS